MFKKWKQKNRADRIFDVFNYLVLGLLGLMVLYPLYFIVIASVSDPASHGPVLPSPILPTTRIPLNKAQITRFVIAFPCPSLFICYVVQFRFHMFSI